MPTTAAASSRTSRGRLAAVGLLAAVAGAACSGGGTPIPSSPAPVTSARPSPSRAAVPTVVHLSDAGFALPAAVQRMVAAADGASILLAGGLDAAGSSTAGVFALDPATGMLREVATLPEPFHDGAGAVLRGRFLVFGGGAAASSDAIQAVSLRGRGPTLAAAGAAVVGHLPTPLSDLAAATAGGTVYLVGGYDGTTPQRVIYATGDGTTVRRVGTLPIGLRYAAVAAAGGRIVVAGGVSPSGPTAAVYAFDPATGRTEIIGHLPSPLAHAAAFTLGGQVYVVGGRNGADRAVRAVERIDPATGRVTRLPPLAAPVADAAAVSLGGQAWVLGGWRGAAVAQVLLARPSSP